MRSIDQITGAAEARSRPACSSVGVLLARSALWGDWLAEHPDRAELLKEAFSCVIRLESHTGRGGEGVLQRLGCDTKTEQELEDLTPQRLSGCIDYMKWVESLVERLDLGLDKQLVLNGAARLFAAAGEDLELVEEVMDAGDFSPNKYLRLGESGQAWKAALRQLKTPTGERARGIHEENPFIDEGTPHMTPMRLEMLAGPDATALLGERIEERMREHLHQCPACAAAWRKANDQASRRAAGVVV